MARASSIRQFVTSTPKSTPTLSLLKSFKLINSSNTINHLFQLHATLITSGDSTWLYKLLKSYSRFKHINYTVSIFHTIGNLSNANTVLKTYLISTTPKQALRFYFNILKLGFVPDTYTFVSLFGCIENINSAKMCHGQVIKHGCDNVLPVQNSLMDMYTCCGASDLGKKVFVEMPKRDIVSWNLLIGVLVRDGDILSAHKLFDEMAERSVVSWNVMIKGYLDANNPGVSIKLFREMIGRGFRGDERTLVALLKACGRSSRLKEGKSVHASLIKTFVSSSVVIDTAVVDMYGKCKEVELARRIFDSLSRRNRVTWNVMILAHCLHGYTKDGFNLFEEMIACKVIPDDVTFVGILSGCARAGLVSRGKRYYGLMVDEFKIKPNFGHKWCMANLYSTAGLPEEAEEALKSLPEEDMTLESAKWSDLLSSSRFTGNTAVAESIAKSLIEKDPMNYKYYHFLMNVYSVAGRWEDVERVKEMVKERRIGRMPGCGLVDLKDIVHGLRVECNVSEKVITETSIEEIDAVIY